jgi:hypothetical protein
MLGRFFHLGTIDSSAAGLSFPRGDGSPSAISATTIALPTSAPDTANFFRDMIVYVAAGSGAGQWRVITSYSTARIATVHAWEAPAPNTGSTLVYGIPMRHADIMHFRSEYTTTTAATGLFRAEVWIEEIATPHRIFSQFFQFAYVGSTFGLQAASSTAHGDTRVADVMPLKCIIGKIYCETAPAVGAVDVWAASGISERKF